MVRCFLFFACTSPFGHLTYQSRDVGTDTGLDQQKFDIPNLLARQPGKTNPVDLRACRTEFARMFDGTHARGPTAVPTREMMA